MNVYEVKDKSVPGDPLIMVQDVVDAGAEVVLTSKGDLATYSTERIREAVGSNYQTLLADSSQTSGIRWSDFGKYELLDDHIASGTESTYTFTETLSVDDYARFFVLFVELHQLLCNYKLIQTVTHHLIKIIRENIIQVE